MSLLGFTASAAFGKRNPGPMRLVVLGLFCISGATALVYELLWMRLLGGLFGVTLPAMSVVLAVFMTGLALGSAWIGNRVETAVRPLRVYAWLELGIGLWALPLPVAIDWLEPLILAVQTHAVGSAWQAQVRIALAAVMMLVPTLLMGGTLPTICRALASESGHPSRVVAVAYALNTLGAVVGVLACGLWLLPNLGITLAHTLTALTNIAVGLVSLGLARVFPHARERARTERFERASAASPNNSTVRHVRVAWLIAALTGAAMLGLQVVWMRALSLFTYDTAFAMSATLAGFLLGIAAGSQAASACVTRVRRPWEALGLLTVGLAVFAVLSPKLLSWFDHAQPLRTSTTVDWLVTSVGGQLLLALAFFCVPAALSGAVLVFVFRLCVRSSREVSSATGRAYAANTVGSTLGALFGGLVLVPWLGSVHTIAVLALLLAAAAVLALLQVRRSKPSTAIGWLGLGVAGALALSGLLSDPASLLASTEQRGRVFWTEDEAGVVEVRREDDGSLTLVSDHDHVWGNTHPQMVASVYRQGLLPLLLHPHPASMVEVGLGTGIQLAPAVLDPAVRRLMVVEISSGILAASRVFAPFNARLHEQSKVALVQADGRHLLKRTQQRFDLIVLGLFRPYRQGSGHLFSHDLYRVCRGRLEPAGLFAQWLPLNQLSETGLRSILKTFAVSFREVHAFERLHYLLLVGADHELDWSPEALQERLSVPALRPVLEAAGLKTPAALYAHYMLDGTAIAKLGEPAPLNTDDQLTLEFDPVDLRLNAGYRNASRNLRVLLPLRTEPAALQQLPQEEQASARRRFRARRHLMLGGIEQSRGNIAQAVRHFKRATQLDPEDSLARGQLQRYREASP